jgi:excisionase family DNA binding protein
MTIAAIECEYLSWDEASRFTGLSVTTLRRLVAEKRLTVFHPTPGRALLSRRELVEVIEASAQPKEA